MARPRGRKSGASRGGRPGRVTGRVAAGRGNRDARRRRPDVAEPSQVGRRPSSPALLAVMGLLWVGAGVVAITSLHARWHLVPGIVFLGIGVLFLRGAAATVVRRGARHDG